MAIQLSLRNPKMTEYRIPDSLVILLNADVVLAPGITLERRHDGYYLVRTSIQKGK